MKINIRLISFTAVLFLLANTNLFALNKEITETAYLKADSLLWSEYETETQKIFDKMDEKPEWSDSLQAVYKRMYEKVCIDNMELAVKFASVPSGLKRVFMVRLKMPKNRIDSIIRSLPEEMRSNPYADRLQRHISSEQIKVGDPVFEFPCVDCDSTQFDWSKTQGNPLLILYGGVDCMGRSGRQELIKLNDLYGPQGLKIIVYCNNASSVEDLRRIRETFDIPVLFVGDFKHDSSPMKIKYGTQATPTCFFIDSNHIVRSHKIGLSLDDYHQYFAK